MERPSMIPSRRPSTAGFTLVELIAAVALLIILMGILFVVFGEAGKTVSIGQARVARYATIRAFFRLVEDDLVNAFFITEGGSTYGLVGENGQDPAFLPSAPSGDSDRLRLIRLRPGQQVAANAPGFVELCYLRRTYPGGQELVPDRRNCLFRVADEDMGTWTPAPPPHYFPAGFLTFAVPDPTNTANNDYFLRYLVALDVSDLQFRYLKLPSPDTAPVWQDTWDPNTDTYDPDGAGPLSPRPAFPIEVEVTIRLGPDSSTNLVDHEAFTQLIHLPLSP
jgi:type II secretory pathway pseudopilin PulG